MKLPSHVMQFGSEKNLKVGIIGGVHGDEKVGVLVLKKLQKVLTENPKEITGTIYLIQGNPNAIKAGKRVIDEDLNRLFSPTVDLKLNSTLEKRRAKELMPLLNQLHFAVDIHSTIKPSNPFIYTKSDTKHLALSKCFEVEYVVQDNGIFQCCMDDAVNANPIGGIAFTLETGWQKDLSQVEKTFKAILRYLQTIGALKGTPENKKPKKPQMIKVYRQVISDHESFRFLNTYENFQQLKKGTELAKSNLSSVKLTRDSFILFPKKTIEKGKMACILAHSITF